MNAPLYQFGLFGENTNLLIALILGIGFGFFLERGGLGSAKKLAAQFYNTDLSVFKVMFSAIITAMLGLFWLSWIGFLDISRVHILPTYLLPQTVGGLIFGVGFVVGGYCPGTSCIAASTGRRDGYVHLIGMIAGIFLFAELYPVLESFYQSTPLGELTIPQLLGISPNLAIAAIVVMALACFVLAFLVLISGESYKGQGISIDPKELAYKVENELDHVSAIEVAKWIMERRTNFRVFDLREPKDFAALHIPGAENSSITSLIDAHIDKNQTVVLYSEGGVHSAQAMFLLWAKGYRNVYMLKGGLNEWEESVLHPQLTQSAPNADSLAALREMVKFFGGKVELKKQGKAAKPVPVQEKEKLRNEC